MSKRKQTWNEDDMQKSLRRIEEGDSLRKAAMLYGIPRSTLSHRLKHGSGKKRGTPSHLTEEDERQIIKHAEIMSNSGRPCSLHSLMEQAGRLAAQRFVSRLVSFCTM